MYKVGQEVVCIEGAVSKEGKRLIKGRTYIIQDTRVCACGGLNLDVGIQIVGTICKRCNFDLGINIWWLRSSRFAPLKEIMEKADNLVKELLQETLPLTPSPEPELKKNK